MTRNRLDKLRLSIVLSPNRNSPNIQFLFGLAFLSKGWGVFVQAIFKLSVEPETEMARAEHMGSVWRDFSSRK